MSCNHHMFCGIVAPNGILNQYQHIGIGFNVAFSVAAVVFIHPPVGVEQNNHQVVVKHHLFRAGAGRLRQKNFATILFFEGIFHLFYDLFSVKPAIVPFAATGSQKQGEVETIVKRCRESVFSCIIQVSREKKGRGSIFPCQLSPFSQQQCIHGSAGKVPAC